MQFPPGSIIDTHVHLFAPLDDPRFPVHPQAPYQPTTCASITALESMMDQAEIQGAFIVHPEPYQDDHRWLIHILEANPQRFRGVCHVLPGDPDLVPKLIDLAAIPWMRGARLHAYCPDRLPDLSFPNLARFWEAAGRAGLFIQLHLEPRYAPAFTPLFEAFPAIPVWIDHCGRPLQGSPLEFALVRDWARFPQVSMKLSMLPPRENYPHRDIAPIAQNLVQAFGPDRILYGGGYPCEVPLDWKRHFERFSSVVGVSCGPNREKMAWGNAWTRW